jgi:hypothetical protein
MLSNSDLSAELETLARQARELAGQVKSNGDMEARTLATGLVEAGKIAQKLEKLGHQLNGTSGRKK